PTVASVFLILSKVTLNRASKFQKSESGRGWLAMCPARNSKLPPLTFTAVERESRGTGSRNSFLSSCARTASIREKLKTTNSGTAIFIVPPITPILHHSSTPTSFDPLLPQHGNRLNLQECSGRPEFSRLDERAGRIAGFKN